MDDDDGVARWLTAQQRATPERPPSTLGTNRLQVNGGRAEVNRRQPFSKRAQVPL